MLIFLKRVNRTFQILEPIIHFSVFQTGTWAEEKPIFIVLALCVIWLCVQWDHFEKVKWLGNLRDVLVSCPIRFFSQERMSKALPISISSPWNYLRKAVLKRRKENDEGNMYLELWWTQKKYYVILYLWCF